MQLARDRKMVDTWTTTDDHQYRIPICFYQCVQNESETFVSSPTGNFQVPLFHWSLLVPLCPTWAPSPETKPRQSAEQTSSTSSASKAFKIKHWSTATHDNTNTTQYNTKVNDTQHTTAREPSARYLATCFVTQTSHPNCRCGILSEQVCYTFCSYQLVIWLSAYETAATSCDVVLQVCRFSRIPVAQTV